MIRRSHASSLLSSSFVSVLGLALLAAACGGAETKRPETPATTPPTAGTTAPANATGAPAKPWKEMSQSEKKMHMKMSVMPKMTEVFQSFDKAKFADVTCVTCHGPGAKNGNFVMPNAALPKLSTEGGFKKHKAEKPEMTAFMMEKVMPAMIDVMGAKPYDPATHQGFGCTACHTLEK